MRIGEGRGHPGEIITDNYPLARGKISAMEGGTRVPLIITGPGIPAGVRSDVMVNGLDFYPTLLSLTGAEKPKDKPLDGCDLAPLLKKDPSNPSLVRNADGTMRDTMVWHFPHSVALESTIRIGDYKLVRNYNHVNVPNTPELELYRLYRTKGGKQVRSDIEEAGNLAESMPEKAQAMNRKLTGILVEMKASYPYCNPDFQHALPNKENVCTVLSHERKGRAVEFGYQENGAKVIRANLLYTLNGGNRDEEWFRTAANLLPGNKVSAELPEGATHYVINLIDENNFLRSYPEMVDMIRSRKEKYSARALSVKAGEAGSAPTSSVKPSAKFVRWDKNNDGQVGRQEYLGFYAPGFDIKDTNQDGVLNAAEFPYEGSFRVGDVNRDGKLTREEFSTVYEHQFNRTHDKNKDGIITPDEV